MKVLIGIQARSTSQRLPGKSLMYMEGKPLISHTIDSAIKAARYLNGSRSSVVVEVALLVPIEDEILDHKWPCQVFEGPEHDVLTRYVMAAERAGADYVVRLTGDCVMLPSQLISKTINVATINELDYVSNVDEELRTSIDGHDCEIISKKALMWLHENALTPKEREHVTIKLRERTYPNISYGVIFGSLDQSHIKLSVDTFEEFKNVENEFKKVKNKIEKAKKRYGKNSVYLFHSS